MPVEPPLALLASALEATRAQIRIAIEMRIIVCPMLGKPATQMVRQSDDHGQQADSQGDNVARNRASDLDGGRFERVVFRIRLSDPHDRDQVVEWPLI
jgi:hypothetical protein